MIAQKSLYLSNFSPQLLCILKGVGGQERVGWEGRRGGVGGGTPTLM